MRSVRGIVTLVIALAAAGCGSLLYRTTHLRSFDQRLAHAYGTHEVITQTVPTAVLIGHLSEENGRFVLVIADEARLVLDHARELDHAGHGVDADQSLRLGWGVLMDLDEFLKSQRPKGFLKNYCGDDEICELPTQ